LNLTNGLSKPFFCWHIDDTIGDSNSRNEKNLDQLVFLSDEVQMDETRIKMNKVLLLGCFMMTSVFVASCISVNVISHDEQQAAKAAYDFANLAFVGKNEAEAYRSTAQDFQENHSEDDFNKLVQQMHEKGYPSQVLATEYQPIPGTETMSIFLIGGNPNENFYYRLVMEGTASSGYKVAGIFRGSGPYPKPEERKKL
jgi:hypothetical protein